MKKLFCVLGAVAFVTAMMCNTTIAENSSKEIAKWRAKAEQGDASAQPSLGSAYFYGEGVEQDDIEAMEWLGQAGNQGHALAHLMLGYIFRRDKLFSYNNDMIAFAYESFYMAWANDGKLGKQTSEETKELAADELFYEFDWSKYLKRRDIRQLKKRALARLERIDCFKIGGDEETCKKRLPRYP